MNRVLYETSYHLRAGYLIFIFMLIGIILFPSILKRFSKANFTEGKIAFAKGFLRAAFAFVVFCLAFSLILDMDMGKKIVGAYNRGDYQIVEGYVENFHTVPFMGKGNESFDINGVPFFYSTGVIHPGYRKTKANGGVITGDGQHLRIGYVTYNFNSSLGNIIVYIEELP